MKRVALLAALVLAGCTPKDLPRPAWDADVVKLFETLPVQDLGRVKPLDTVAGFKLLKLRGVRSCPTPAGETLAPTPWLMDVLFYPEIAEHYEVFLVQNSDVLDAIGVSHETKRKRDRYAWVDLAPGKDKLFELARQYAQVKDADRSAVQEQVVQLAHNVSEYMQLAHFLDFARERLALRGSPALREVFGPQDEGLALFLAKAPKMRGAFEKASQEEQQGAFRALFDQIDSFMARSSALVLFPPTSLDRKDWMSPAHLIDETFKHPETPLGSQVALLATLEKMEHAKKDPTQFKALAIDFHGGLRSLADARGEFSKVPLEVAFYKGDFFYRALMLFGFGFLAIALSWLWPLPLLRKGSIALTALGTVLLVTGIVLRCIIRSRPPVSTLYETILFISAVAILTSAVIESINRQGIALSLAPLLGAMGMFLANKYEFKESLTTGDTMTSLVAVLDTNFWLATHVTCVTAGYSAGLLAAAIAHVWLLGKVSDSIRGRFFGAKPRTDQFYKGIARMTYGVLCFGLLFSTVGTILGGIWANYSWGRFWGWDPKENGALMICLWELIILHARLGGYIRDFGLAVLATLGGLVIAFSWWGVNLLGVGLHSYGFTTGVFQILVAFYVVELLIVAAALVWWFGSRFQFQIVRVEEPAKSVGSAPTASPEAPPAS